MSLTGESNSTYRTPGAISAVPVLAYEAQRNMRAPRIVVFVAVSGCVLSLGLILSRLIETAQGGSVNAWLAVELTLCTAFCIAQYLGAFRRMAFPASFAGTLLFGGGAFWGMIVVVSVFESIVSPNAQQIFPIQEWIGVLLIAAFTIASLFAGVVNWRWSAMLRARCTDPAA